MVSSVSVNYGVSNSHLFSMSFISSLYSVHYLGYLLSPTNPLYHSLLSRITSVVCSVTVYWVIYTFHTFILWFISFPYSPTLLWPAPPDQYSTLLLTGELLNTRGFMTKITNPQPSIQLITRVINNYLSHWAALHCNALHCTALHCTALHCTALHYYPAKNCNSLFL